MKTAIIDIDGTLADCRHRLHYVLPGSRPNWEAFFGCMGDDTVIDPVRKVVTALATMNRVVLCSGRPENYRNVTEQWLDDNGISYDRLYMRPANDTRPDHVVKRQILAGIIEDGYEPFVVIDDRNSVVEMWRDEGLVCLQAAPPELDMPLTAKLTLMVGPSGAGKTTWIEQNYHPASVISTDTLRQEMCGDFRDQSKNSEVFQAVHALAKARLRLGLPVVIDATNIRRKDRVNAAMLVPCTNTVEYVVINRPMAEKRMYGGWRNEVVKGGEPFDLLAAHEQTFNSNLKDILRGDGLPNVVVQDLRDTGLEARAA